MKTLLSAFAFLLLLNTASAASQQLVFLPDNLNKCLRNVEVSIHTERIKKDEELLGGYKNQQTPFRSVRYTIAANNMEETTCGKQLISFMDAADAFFQDYGVYAVFGRKDGTEALNRLGHFTRQPQYFYGGL